MKITVTIEHNGERISRERAVHEYFGQPIASLSAQVGARMAKDAIALAGVVAVSELAANWDDIVRRNCAGSRI